MQSVLHISGNTVNRASVIVLRISCILASNLSLHKNEDFTGFLVVPDKHKNSTVKRVKLATLLSLPRGTIDHTFTEPENVVITP
jgi:hypothetical protein